MHELFAFIDALPQLQNCSTVNMCYFLYYFISNKEERSPQFSYIYIKCMKKSNNNSISHHQVCPIFSHTYTHSFCKRKKHLYKFFYNESKQKFVIIPFLTHQTLLPAAIGRHRRAFLFYFIGQCIQSMMEKLCGNVIRVKKKTTTHGERAFYETARICRHR